MTQHKRMSPLTFEPVTRITVVMLTDLQSDKIQEIKKRGGSRNSLLNVKSGLPCAEIISFTSWMDRFCASHWCKKLVTTSPIRVSRVYFSALSSRNYLTVLLGMLNTGGDLNLKCVILLESSALLDSILNYAQVGVLLSYYINSGILWVENNTQICKLIEGMFSVVLHNNNSF